MIVVTHSKTLVAPDSGVEDKVYGSDYVDPASHTVALGADDNFVTDAQLVVVANTSGVNTGDQTNITGNAGTVTTNANLTGPITSTGNATAVAAQTGTGSVFAMQAGPTFTGTVVAPAIDGTTVANGDMTIQGTSSGTRTTSMVFMQPNGGRVWAGPPGIDAFVTPYLTRSNLFATTTDDGGYGVLGFGEITTATSGGGLYGIAVGKTGADMIYGFGAEAYNLQDTGTMTEIVGGYTYAEQQGDGDADRLVSLLVYGNFNTGAGDVAENFGMLIENQTAGTDNYAIQTGAGYVYFGDEVEVLGELYLNARVNLKSYTVATLPAVGAAGGVVYVSNAAVAPCMAFSNGTNWKRCDNAATTVI